MGREAAAAVQQQGQGGTAYTVEQLVAFNRYNPDILPDLENYVNDQVLSLTFLLFYHSYHLFRVYTIQFNSNYFFRFHRKLTASNQISAFFASTR